jgi:PAS domain S-box-containing protein
MSDKVNVLLVDDQPGKLLATEEILRDLGENLLKASSAREALDSLLRYGAAVVLIDVCMPELDGFQLAELIRDHPRFQKTAIIFISAIQVADVDRLRGYQLGAVDYVPVPVVPELLRAKVKVFAELYRKTRELERFNAELEERVAARTAELEASNAQLLQSEQARSLALAAGQMGSWQYDLDGNQWKWDEGQYRIFGVDPDRFDITLDNLRAMIPPEDWERLQADARHMVDGKRTVQTEFRVRRPSGEMRWCLGTAVASREANRPIRVSGVTLDITERREAEQRQDLLTREVDHRARNALAVVHSFIRLTRADSVQEYVAAIEGRIRALSRAHALLSASRWSSADLDALVREELAPFRSAEGKRVVITGPSVSLLPQVAQGLAMALHELTTNAAKYGALSSTNGAVSVTWQVAGNSLVLEWSERGSRKIAAPDDSGFGLRVISSSIEGQLGGQVKFDWRPDGLHCTFSVPWQPPLSPSLDRPKNQNDVVSTARRPNSAGKQRILVVEDEVLVGMMIEETLTEWGHSVIGPISKASEALLLAEQSDCDAAVLDINLGDGTVYPIANILSQRRVPFVFVTSYESEAVDKRFDHVPILQKPVEIKALREFFPPRQAVSDMPAKSADELYSDPQRRTG